MQTQLWNEENACAFVKDAYGFVRVEFVKSLPSYEDVNMMLKISNDDDDDDEKLCILKLFRNKSKESLEMQDLLKSTLHGKGVTVPFTMENRFSEKIVKLDEDGSFAILVNYLPGEIMAKAEKNSSDIIIIELLINFGIFLGKCCSVTMDALKDVDCAIDHDWDLAHARRVYSKYMSKIEDSLPEKRRKMLHHFVALYEERVLDRLDRLPRTLIHSDANDYNVLVANDDISGLIDFGDMCKSHTINELAIAAAYGILDQNDPVKALLLMTTGYCMFYRVSEDEVYALYPLMCMRLVISVIRSTYEKLQQPDNFEYLNVTEPHAWKALETLFDAPQASFENVFKSLCTARGLANHINESTTIQNVHQYVTETI